MPLPWPVHMTLCIIDLAWLVFLTSDYSFIYVFPMTAAWQHLSHHSTSHCHACVQPYIPPSLCTCSRASHHHFFALLIPSLLTCVAVAVQPCTTHVCSFPPPHPPQPLHRALLVNSCFATQRWTCALSADRNLQDAYQEVLSLTVSPEQTAVCVCACVGRVIAW